MNTETTPAPSSPAAPEVADAPLVKSFEITRPGELQKFVDRMNRRAKKLGIPPLTLEIGKPTIKQQTLTKAHVFEGVMEVDPMATRTYGVEVYPVTISVQRVKLPGPWEFAGRIDHEEAGNILAAVPGVEMPERFRTAPCACEHCKTDRRRAQTYVVRNVKEDRHVQVGTDCIRDFLGHDSPELLAQQLAFVSNISILIDDMAGEGSDREFSGMGSGKTFLSVEDTLVLTNAIIREHGYVSGSKARESFEGEGRVMQSTRARVFDVMNDRKGEFRGKYVPTDEDAALAKKVLTWAREDLATTPHLNDYQNNLVTVTSADMFNERHLGILVSAPAAYGREMGIRTEREKKARITRHVGVVGERVDFDLTLRKTIPLEGDFGLSTICLFDDAEGNTIKWKASGHAPCNEGDRILLKGTIKQHDNYKGIPQTVVTRCKVIKAVKVLPTVRPEAAPPAAPSAAPSDLKVELAPPVIHGAPARDLAAPAGPEMG